jgi:hypothetical protein
LTLTISRPYLPFVNKASTLRALFRETRRRNDFNWGHEAELFYWGAVVRKLNSFPIGRQNPSLDGFSFASPICDGAGRHSIQMSGGPAASGLHRNEASGEGETVASTLGLHLRVARQGKGLDLAQVSGSLKISKRHLNAIEEGRLDALPAGNAYLLGYTRSYASYLGLNASKFVEELKFEITERASREVVFASSLPPCQPLSAVRRVVRLFLDVSHFRRRSN